MNLCANLSVSEDGHLLFAGQDTLKLASQYGTPLYVVDEDRVRFNCQVYTKAFAEHFRPGSMPLYAGKANAFKSLTQVVASENMGLDVVSPGEIYNAKFAGFDMSKTFFHGNNKTDEDVAFAFDNGVGYFVADNPEELYAIENEAKKRNVKQNVILRITPGIDPHTYEAINTGMVDSKFGQAIETGQASDITELALSLPHVVLKGYHCHVGSQVFAEDVFERAAAVMLTFMADMRDKFGYAGEILDLGGGYGVRYVDSDPESDIVGGIARTAKVIHETCEKLNFPEPLIMMEPGRSIIADAGLTLYTAGTVKRIPGYKNYVSVDGGMADNPRFALYGSKYSCFVANKMNEEKDGTFDLVGRCCESGDILQKAVNFPDNVTRGDIIAVATTGAYNYSMSSNYNRIPRPATVMLKDGESRMVIRRETYADLSRYEV